MQNSYGPKASDAVNVNLLKYGIPQSKQKSWKMGYLIVWGHNKSTWGSGGRNNSHFFQGRTLCMTVVLVPWMTSSICMVIALLLLLVLLKWLKKQKIQLRSSSHTKNRKSDIKLKRIKPLFNYLHSQTHSNQNQILTMLTGLYFFWVNIWTILLPQCSVISKADNMHLATRGAQANLLTDSQKFLCPLLSCISQPTSSLFPWSFTLFSLSPLD